MVSYKTYLPSPLKSLSSQTAQVGTLVALVLTLVTTIGCVSSGTSSLYLISILTGDQTFTNMKNSTLAPISYQWTKVGIWGECSYSAVSNSMSCTTPRHPYYFEPPYKVNMPQNMDTLLLKGGIASSVMFTIGCVVLGLSVAMGTCAVVLREKSSYFTHVARACTALGTVVITAATCLVTAMYAKLNNLLKDFDNGDGSGMELETGLHTPGSFQPHLGSTGFALLWISVLAGLVATASWIKTETPKNREKKSTYYYPYY